MKYSNYIGKVVKVTWQDTVSNIQWTDIKYIDGFLNNDRSSTITEIGKLIKCSKTHLLITSQFSNDDMIGTYVKIPRLCISNIKELK